MYAIDCVPMQPELTREVESLGGKVVSKVTDNTTICISDKSESVSPNNHCP